MNIDTDTVSLGGGLIYALGLNVRSVLKNLGNSLFNGH